MSPGLYSNWIHLIPVFGYVHRYLGNLRRSKGVRVSGELSAAELEHVSVAPWRHAQQEIFAQEYEGKKERAQFLQVGTCQSMVRRGWSHTW